MRYFNTLPLITQNDFNGNKITVNNLITRAYFLPSLLKNVVLFYDYTIQEDDTPEMISYKYYGSCYDYWLVLYANSIIDPQESWPLSSNQFDRYIISKYKNDAPPDTNILQYTKEWAHHYEKKITVYNDVDLIAKSTTIRIDPNEYYGINPMPITTESDLYIDGKYAMKITQVVEKRRVTIYQYESELNESKRNIKIMNSQYLGEAETQFNRLMSTKYV